MMQFQTNGNQTIKLADFTLPSPPVICTGDIDGMPIEDTLMTNLTCSTVSPTAYLPSSITTNTHSLHSYHTGLDVVPLSTHSQPLTPDVQPAVTLPSPPVICTGDTDGTLIEDITVEDSTGATTSLPAPLPSSVTTSSHIVETTNSTQFISALENAIHQARLETDTSSQLPNNIKIICHQLNCHRSVGPIDNLQSLISSSTPSSPYLCFIQEPPTNKDNKLTAVSKSLNITAVEEASSRPRAALLISHNLNNCCTPLTEFMTSDIAAARITTDSSASDLIVCSFYWDYTTADIPISLHKLCAFASTNRLPIILGGDANAHHTAWGSTNTNKRGEQLMDLILRYNMSISNDGSMTFQNILRCEALDVTLGNPEACDLISSWHVSDSPSLSDHSLINFNINLIGNISHPSATSSRRRSIKRNSTDAASFQEHLADLITSYAKHLSAECNTVLELNDKTELINTIIHKASKLSQSHHFVSSTASQKKLKSPWWTKELKILRNRVRRCWNKWKRSGALTDLSAYKKSNNKYVKIIKKTKNSSWQNHCSNTSSSRSKSAHLIKHLKHSKASLSSLKKGDGTFTQTALETLTEFTNKDTMTSNPSLQSSEGIVYCPSLSPTSDQPSPSELATLICTKKRIDKAFSSLTNKKAPGPDNISNNLIILSWPQLNTYFYDLFKDSLRLGAIPYLWHSSTGIFLPKPGKKQHFLAQNWRSINLCSSLLKLLEKTVLLYLNEELDIDQSLSNDQLGFRKGRSTDEALHKVVSFIEEALSKGHFALTCFVDIKAAFDSISFKSIIAALERSGIDSHLIKWITNLLGNRKVLFSLKGVSLIKYMLKGTPQGGVLSPLLWNLVINSLLVSLDTSLLKPDFTQGFADDLVTAVTGENLPILIDRMQLIVNTINDWCKANDLELSPHKTSLVLFTWKRKFVIDTPILIDDHPINYSTDVRYLGLILDQKLNWKKHVDHVLHKATWTLLTAKRTIGKNWGYSKNTAQWIYKSVVLPAVTYGCHVWGLNPKSHISAKLSKVQSLACRTIVHCPKYSSRRTMETTTGILPLQSEIQKSARSTLFRLQGQHRFNIVHNTRTKFEPHSSIHSARLTPSIEHWDITRPEKFRTPMFTTNLANEELMRDLISSHKSVTDRFHFSCFTDGSRLNNKTGAALVVYSKHNEEPLAAFKWRLDDRNTVFQAELMAIREASTCLRSLPCQNASVAIFTDSLSAVQALSAEASSSLLCIETRRELDTLTSLCSSVSLTWIRGHTGIRGNELADTLAKEGTISSSFKAVPLPVSHFKSSLREDIFTARVNSWSDSTSSNPLHSLLKHYSSPQHINFFKTLNRRNSRILTAFLDNRAPLQAFVNKLDATISPICSYCLSGRQDNSHVLFYCPSFELQRLRHLGSLPHLADFNRIPPHTLLKFLLDTPLFKKFAK